MAVSITVRAPGPSAEAGTDATLTFDGQRVVIGRGAGCDVRLPDPSVSHRHASMRARGTEYALVDEGSTNGTFVGGVRLAPSTPRSLRSGDLIRVGRVWLEVKIDQRPATRDLAMATRDLALAFVADAMEAMGDDVTPRIRVVEGRDLDRFVFLREEGRPYLIGRDAECDLPLADADASRRHVQVVRRGTSMLLRDLGSKNPAMLGDVTLTSGRDVHWKGRTMLRLGRTVLALIEPVQDALQQLEEAVDDPLDPAQEPPAPPTRQPVSQAEVLPDPPAAPAKAQPAPPPRTPPRSRVPWTGTDIAVVIAAVGIIAVSIAGLYWLLRG